MDARRQRRPLSRPLATLGLRCLGFGLTQLLVALVLVMSGRRASESASYWLLSGALINLGTLLWLWRATSAEGQPLRSVWLADQRQWKKDLGVFAFTLLVGGPVAFFPMQWLSLALWGDPQTGSRLMFTAAPAWVALGAGLVFALSHPFAELPAYCGYSLPRLREALGSRWAAGALVAAALSLQHVTLPFLFDWRFVVYRALMFLPFALGITVAVDRRPSLLPYFMGVHFLMDAQLPVMVWLVSTGKMTM
jgi:hypothetical protein